MRKHVEAESLARDSRFNRITLADRFEDARLNGEERRLTVDAEDVADRARRAMHGIFVGEIQALEGAGRVADGSFIARCIPWSPQRPGLARHQRVQPAGDEAGGAGGAGDLLDAMVIHEPIFPRQTTLA